MTSPTMPLVDSPPRPLRRRPPTKWSVHGHSCLSVWSVNHRNCVLLSFPLLDRHQTDYCQLISLCLSELCLYMSPHGLDLELSYSLHLVYPLFSVPKNLISNKLGLSVPRLQLESCRALGLFINNLPTWTVCTGFVIATFIHWQNQ